MKKRRLIYLTFFLAATLVGLCGKKMQVYAADESTPTDAVLGDGTVKTGDPEITHITVYEGVDYSDVYDYDYYISHNDDVKEAFKGDEEKTLRHFVTYGMYERRQGSADFDVRSYANEYQDLRNAFEENSSRYYVHYINFGKNEGRIATGTTVLKNPVTVNSGVDYKDVYDYDYYISVYKDIKDAYSGRLANDVAALKHFINNGVKEKRQASSQFDIKSYINEYQDLRRAFGTAWNRYLTHYENNGKNENRKTVGTATMKNCMTVYVGKDSSGNTITTDYADVYDFIYYLGRYSDLDKVFRYDDAGALKHFVDYGMNEGRQAKETFDVNSYKRSYQDLRVAFYKDNKRYYEHYIKNGKKEGRKAVGETKLQNPVTVKAGVDFSPIYDYYFYIKHQDVKELYGEDDIATLDHFVRYGINEGRYGKPNFNQAEYASFKEKAKEIVEKEDLERMKALGRARNPRVASILDEIGWKLDEAYLWTARNITYYGKYEFTESWGSGRLAEYGFDNRRGNCFVFAAVFYEFAKVMGFDAHQVSGFVNTRRGGRQAHSWVEIVQNGKVYYCDPEQKYENDHAAFMREYGAKGLWQTVDYHRMN